jgi:hypothetical protein
MNRLADMTTTTGLRGRARYSPWETSYSKVGARERRVEGQPFESREEVVQHWQTPHSPISARRQPKTRVEASARRVEARILHCHMPRVIAFGSRRFAGQHRARKCVLRAGL